MRKYFLCFLLLGLLPSQGNASFLRLVPTIQVTAVEGSAGVARISGKIENQGDEPALDVKIESAREGKILADIGNMGPGEKKDLTADLPEKELAIEKDGSYLLPLRVIYKDGNRVSFSAAIILNYTKKSAGGALARSSPVSVVFEEEVRKTGSIEIDTAGDFKTTLSNTGATPVDVTLELVGPRELEFAVDAPKIQLGPQQQKKIKVRIYNISALHGSSYASFALVSGLIDGQSFSDYVGFAVKVNPATSQPWLAYVFALFALGIVGSGLYFWKKGV